MAEKEVATFRRWAIAETLIVAGLLVFMAPLVIEPLIGSPDWANLLLSLAGLVLCTVAVLLIYGRSKEFLAYLSIGKEKERALWRSRPVREAIWPALVLFLAAVIIFRDEWTLRADQIAAIIIAVLVLSEVIDRLVKAMRSTRRAG